MSHNDKLDVTSVLHTLFLGGQHLHGNETVDDKRTGNAAVPHRTSDSLLEPVGVDSTEEGQCCQQQKECTGQAVHAAQRAHVDKLADQLRVQEVDTGTQLYQDVADCCRSEHSVRRC